MSEKSTGNRSKKMASPPQRKACAGDESNKIARDLEKWSLAALESAPFGVMVHDPEGKILIFNSQLEKISGYRQAEIPDIQTWISRLYPDHDYRELVSQERKKKIPKNRLRIREAIITRKNGEKRICEFSSILSSSGIRTVFIKDTNVLRETENSLRESEERFRLLSQATFEGILIHKDGVLLFANDQFFEMFGYEAQDLLGKQALPLCIAPQSLPFTKQQIRKGTSTPYEVTGLKKNGETFPILVHAKSMDYQDNEVRVAAIRDLSYRYQTQSALQKSEERFRAMADNIREVFWLYDCKNQKVEYVSPAYEHLWGRPIEKLYANYKEWAASIYPDDRAYTRKFFKRIVQSGGSETWEYRIVRPDGAVRWVSDRGFAITNNDGDVVRIAGIAEDITERRRAMEALRESEEKFRTVTEQSPNMIFINRRGRVVYANRKCEEIMGYSRDEFYAPDFDFMTLVEPEFKDLIQSNINDLIAPLASNLSSKYFSLTPSEIQIADLIKYGKTSKEIAVMLNVSPKAVSFHRGNIRKKLGLLNKKINLRSYLQAFPH